MDIKSLYSVVEGILKVIDTKYRKSPTYMKITNMVSTTMVSGLCMCK